MKDMAGWHTAGVDLSKYLEVGDAVSEDLMMYFLEVLPPATWRPALIQIGEPFDLVNGRATFSTIYRRHGGWFYAGNCHRGEGVEPKANSPLTNSR